MSSQNQDDERELNAQKWKGKLPKSTLKGRPSKTAATTIDSEKLRENFISEAKKKNKRVYDFTIKEITEILNKNGLLRVNSSYQSVYTYFRKNNPRPPSKNLCSIMRKAIDSQNLKLSAVIVAKAEQMAAKDAIRSSLHKRTEISTLSSEVDVNPSSSRATTTHVSVESSQDPAGTGNSTHDKRSDGEVSIIADITCGREKNVQAKLDPFQCAPPKKLLYSHNFLSVVLYELLQDDSVPSTLEASDDHVYNEDSLKILVDDISFKILNTRMGKDVFNITHDTIHAGKILSELRRFVKLYDETG